MTKIEFFLKRHLKKPAFKLFCALGRVLSPFTDKEIQKETVRRILIFQGGGIGDVVRIFPLLRPLQEAFPHASLTVLSPFDMDLFSLFSHMAVISDNILIDTAKTHRRFLDKLKLAKHLRARHFDLIICPQVGLGMIEFATLCFLIGAPYRIGHDKYGSGFLFTTKHTLKDDQSIYTQNVDLLRCAGIHAYLDNDYLTVPPDALSFAQSFLKERGVERDDILVALAPTVSADTLGKSPQHEISLADPRTWPEEYYADLIEHILRTFGAKVLILGDKPPSGRLSGFLINGKNPNVISAIGRTTIRYAAGLVSLANLLISNDSGLLHIAIALRIPCIGIFGSTSPAQVILTAHHSCVPIWKGLDCSPCFVHQPIPDFECPYDMRCLKAISVEEVMSAAASLLKPSHPRLSAYESPLHRE